LFYGKRACRIAAYLLGPSVIWCMLTGVVASVIGRLFQPDDSVVALASLIVFGPVPLLLILGVMLAYFAYQHDIWMVNERISDVGAQKPKPSEPKGTK